MEAVKQIVDGLSDPQRRWMTMQGSGSRCTVKLTELGLIRKEGVGRYQLTPLGSLVRAYLMDLMEQDNDH